MARTNSRKYKYQFNAIQAEQLAKYFLDLSKVTFTLLVIGILVTEKWLALQSSMWYGSVGLTLAFLVLGMFFYRGRI